MIGETKQGSANNKGEPKISRADIWNGFLHQNLKSGSWAFRTFFPLMKKFLPKVHEYVYFTNEDVAVILKNVLQTTKTSKKPSIIAVPTIALVEVLYDKFQVLFPIIFFFDILFLEVLQ